MEFQELSMVEMEEVNGGSWLDDAVDWIGEKLSQLWDWMKKYGKTDGNPGIII